MPVVILFLNFWCNKFILLGITQEDYRIETLKHLVGLDSIIEEYKTYLWIALIGLGLTLIYAVYLHYEIEKIKKFTKETTEKFKENLEKERMIEKFENEKFQEKIKKIEEEIKELKDEIKKRI
ncbi:MAG: hypothetical protein ABIM85_01495 [candidate division WOR-3 bacterium]